MTIHCAFDVHDGNKSIANKKAVGAVMFLLFIFYTLLVIFAELRRGTKVIILTTHYL
jgi:hypothetical protein